MVAVQVTDRAPRRTQQERRATTRAALLAAAARAIVENGPATSVAGIARRANVSIGALQHHFNSKADLLVAVVDEGWNDLVERSMTVDRSLPLAERVCALVHDVWESYQRPECRAAHMISSDPNIDAEVARRAVPVFDAVRERLDLLWSDVFADLALPMERVALARRFARAHLAGMVVQRQMSTIEPDPDEELVVLCRATLRILTDGDA